MIITDDLLVQMLAHTLARVDQADLTEAIRTGPARCATSHHHPDAWYHPRGRTRGRAPSWHAPLAICARCEVATPCGLLALQQREPWGIWGGMTERRRATIHAALTKIGQATGTPHRRPTHRVHRPGQPLTPTQLATARDQIAAGHPIRDIAKGLDISRTTLYRHFPRGRPPRPHRKPPQ